jgi:hypothetical protein
VASLPAGASLYPTPLVCAYRPRSLARENGQFFQHEGLCYYWLQPACCYGQLLSVLVEHRRSDSSKASFQVEWNRTLVGQYVSTWQKTLDTTTRCIGSRCCLALVRALCGYGGTVGRLSAGKNLCSTLTRWRGCVLPIQRIGESSCSHVFVRVNCSR